MPEVKPNTPYQWKEEEVFELNGKEFELLINTVRAILNTTESQKILLLARVAELLEGQLVKGIESGKVFPAPEQPPTEQTNELKAL